MKLKKMGKLFAFLFVLLFIFSSCAPVKPTAAEIKRQKNVLGILEEAKGDMESVRTILNDTDLDMAGEKKEEEATGESAEVQMQEMEKLLNKVQGYEADLEKRAAAIKQRDVQGEAILESFGKSELHCVELLNDLLKEYDGIIEYLKLVFKVSETLGSLQAIDMNNLDPWYKSFSDMVKATLDELNATTPPSFLQSFHADLIKGIQDTKSSIDYLLVAAQIGDPVRLDAAMYRITVFMRDFGSAMTSVQEDVKRREEKIKQDAMALKKYNDGFSDWIDKNLERMDQEEGSETK